VGVSVPAETLDTGVTFTPGAAVANYGNTPVNAYVRVKIGTVYNDSSLLMGIPIPGDTDTLSFSGHPFRTSQVGLLVVTCSTELAGDMNPGNDAKRETICVRAPEGCLESGSGAAPKALAVDAPRPNPSHDVVTISYTLPHSSNASLKLYDVKGRLVTTLAEGFCEAGISHTATVDARQLARGVYLLKLNSGGCSRTRKLILE
jgi:hypothetical protein